MACHDVDVHPAAMALGLSQREGSAAALHAGALFETGLAAIQDVKTRLSEPDDVRGELVNGLDTRTASRKAVSQVGRNGTSA